jgi:hypothetical protein
MLVFGGTDQKCEKIRLNSLLQGYDRNGVLCGLRGKERFQFAFCY